MKATKLEDMQNLLHRIKIGTIRPEESYEGAQNGLSRKELEGIALQRDRLLNQLNSTHSEVVRLTRELEDVHDRCDRLAKDINSATGKKALLRQLIDELLGKSADGSISCWPLVSRRGVVEKITTILDDTE